MSKLSERIARGEREHGEKFSAAALLAVHQEILHHYETGYRVEITTVYPSGETEVRRGRISTTTGWVPAFILMARRGAHGSGDILGPRDRVTAIVTRDRA